ncbi:MAG: hypothetical protein PHC92_04255, partial [Syntrophomonadaceae bacterium]|nr:hypothetical protein [Syntrophomonadaceae bacterium]
LSEIHNSSQVIQRVIGPGKNGYVERYGSDEVLYAQWNEAAQSYDLFKTDGEGQRTGESIAKAAPDDEEYDFIGESYPLEATDTEGSDTEDEKGYQASAARREVAEKLIAREKGRLNVGSTAKRLEALDKAETPEAKNKAMFQKATRPTKKRLYRKEAKFLESQVKVGELSRLPSDPTEKDKAALKGLNQSLAEGTPIGEAEQAIDTEFQVAQYRGLFYTKSGFPSKELRKQHRKLDERQRPVFSTAALDTGARGREGYYALYNDPGKKEELQGYQADLEAKGDSIVKEIHGLHANPAVPEAVKAVPGGTKRLKPKSLADLNSHFYSQDYKGYMAAMQSYLDRQEGDKEEALDPIFGRLKSTIVQHADKPLIKASNPKVSTGATPVHASKYAFGLKPYKGSEGDVLDPKYDRSGKPRHPYGGKFYTSVHPLSDFDEHGPTPIVPLQNQHRVNLSQMIVPEHESQYDWMMKKDRVQMQYLAKYPNFSKPYKAVYAEKYGLTQELFENFKTDLLKAKPGDERVFVESLLSKHLSQHLDLRAVDDAERLVKGTEEEREKEAKLAYRTGEKSFGFEPPDIERAPIERRRKAKTEREEDEGAAHTPPHKKHRVERSREPEPLQIDTKTDTAQPQPVKQKHLRKRRSSEKSEKLEPAHFAAEHEQDEGEAAAHTPTRKKHRVEPPHITEPPQIEKSSRQSRHSAKITRRRRVPKNVAPAKL